MHRASPRRKAISEGERSFATAMLATALFGAGIGFVVALRFGDGVPLPRALSLYEYWIMCSGALGAALGTYLLRYHIGRLRPDQPLRDLPRAAAVQVIASALGAVIAGTLALPLYGTMFGPFTLLVILAGSPLLILLWGVQQVATYLLMRIWHQERDSIFVTRTAIAPQMRRR